MKCRCPCPCPSFRTIFTSLALLTVLSLTLLFIHQAVLPCLGYLIPSLGPTLYDLAVYGTYPTNTYITFSLHPTTPNIVAWNDDACSGDSLTLLSPFGAAVPEAGPMILDATGNLVWQHTGLGTVMNLRVQSFNSTPYITFWAGAKVGGIGQGNYFMLNSSYDTVHKVAAVSPINVPDIHRHGDLHEFIITDEGTALLTVYDTIRHDLTAMGRGPTGWIVDSMFQEVDIATGELLFEWRASDHFDPATSSMYLNPFGGYKEGNPYDFFHINSLQKDRDGNYLISSRHLHAIMTIDRVTGKPLWILGGPLNDFEDLSPGIRASNFKWQHDARWVNEDEGLLSVFDNGSAGPIMTDASQSRGLLVRIDPSTRKVELVREFLGQHKILSASQGSVQLLSAQDTADARDHVFVGWGSSAVFSEYDLATGTLLCETHIAASATFYWERVKSYRALKTSIWVGRPEYPPVALQSGDRIYVSWNGATEVHAWQLEGRRDGADASEWWTIDIKEKVGFEDSFTVPVESYAALRVAALDARGELLAHSEDVSRVAETKTGGSMWILFGIFGVVGGSMGCWMSMKGRVGGRIWGAWWDRHRYRKVPGIEMN